jgi:hypothetical protein
MGNPEAAEAMGQYMEARQKIESLLEQDSPDPEALKRLSAEMDAHQQRLSLMDDVKALTEAREGFSGLIAGEPGASVHHPGRGPSPSPAAAATAEAAAAAAGTCRTHKAPPARRKTLTNATGGMRLAISPMMQQYLEIKEAHKDAVLFFRLGDFYEMFFEDAVEMSGNWN